MSQILQDLRFGFRTVARSRALSLTAILTLGLGIACTTTVFSWVDSILLHPYPGTARPSELLALEMVSPAAPNGGTSISWPDFLDYRQHLQSLSGLAVRRQSTFSIGDAQPAQLAWGELVSANYFDVLGVRPQLGRFFSSAESANSLGAFPVAVISARLWRSHFHSDPAIAGKTLRVNRHPLTILGVAPEEFRGGSPVMQFDLWVPATMGPELAMLPTAAFTERGYRGTFNAIARLHQAATLPQARAEAASLAASLETSYPNSNRGLSATLLPTWDEHNGVNEYLRNPLLILLAVSLLVLLIVCANVANLLLARSISRQREFGIRVALGAGRWRVASQMLTETLLIAVAAAATSVLFLLWMQGSLIAMVPSIGYPISTASPLNLRILACTAALCLLTAAAAGAGPALFVFHTSLNEVLKEGSRGDTSGSSSNRTRGLLVIAEVALATVALVGAGLFVKSFDNIRTVDPGLDASNVLLGRLFLESAGYSTAEIHRFSQRLQDRLLSAPGVESVSYTDFVPLSSPAGPYTRIQAEGYTPATGESTNINRALVSPAYFATLRIPLLEGREFTPRDDAQSAPVFIVNQSFANRFFAGASPIGRKVRASGRWGTVVGLARDGKYLNLTEPATPHIYLAFAQFYNATPELYFLVRSPAPQPAQLLRQALSEVDPNTAALHTVPLAEYVEVSSFGPKVAARLMSALGFFCLLLAASGLYSVMAYSVSRRLPEIGIRMVMGATPVDVIAMVVGQGMTLALAGVAAGAVAAFALSRLLAASLFQVNAADPATYLLAALFLSAIALLATALPALKATRTDPAQALKR